MKILHFSDTHLGIGIENTSREEDFYLNFQKFITEAITLKPDLIVHSGDLFHTAKPSNKAISVVVSGFLELSKNNIPLVLIAGNHDTPRLSTTTHSFEIFRDIGGVYLAYLPTISSFEIGNYNLVCLPHIHDENIFLQKLGEINNYLKKDKKNIFVSHFGFSAKEYDEYTDEISGINIPTSALKDMLEFDYVALGHYHKHFILKNASYSGSIENTSFNGKDNNIGYNLVDFSNSKTQIEHIKLPSRKMLDLGIIDCVNLGETSEIIDYFDKNYLKNDFKNAILKVSFSNINSKLMLSFDDNLIVKYFENTFYFEYKKNKQNFIGQEFSQNFDASKVIFEGFNDFLVNFETKNNIKITKEIKDEIALKIKGI